MYGTLLIIPHFSIEEIRNFFFFPYTINISSLKHDLHTMKSSNFSRYYSEELYVRTQSSE